ncbi:MAG: helix-turn-helix transcriptional regulator [Oscillospiraceae bacterium]|nr:helix-turn-helix transcriptional regulator [Oscillospiraceae bacterium]
MDYISEQPYIFFPNIQIRRGEDDAVNDGSLPRFLPLREATMDYHRGDFEPAKRCFRDTEDHSPAKLTTALLALAAAISSGDYALYDDIHTWLQGRLALSPGPENELRLRYPEYMAAASMGAPEMLPGWLKSGDLSAAPASLRPGFLLFHMMCLRAERKYEQLLGTAKTALAVYSNPQHFIPSDILYCLLGALAAYNLGERETALGLIGRAARDAMPYGFIVPFAEYVNGCGGLIEEYLLREYPEQARQIIKLAPRLWKNWIDFHNKYTQDNITTILTPKEYHVAELLKNGATYAQAAESLRLSIGRVRCIVSDIYGKLCINSKSELSRFIL